MASFDDLLPLKALMKEREALHNERSKQAEHKIQVLQKECEKQRALLASYETREVAFRKARDDFRRDVKDLERASLLLQQRENEVDAKNDDLERQSRKYQANIRSLQDELDAKTSQLTTVMEQFGRFREQTSSETVSRRALEDLQKDYEQRVPKEAYDRLTVKVGELQRRMDHEYTPNENVEELRFKLKRFEQQIESSYVSNHVYQRAIDDMKTVQESVTVLDEAKNLALEASAATEARLASTQMDLNKALADKEKLEVAGAEARADAERLRGALQKLTESEETLTKTVLEAEMQRNNLLTQVGSLKATSKKDKEERMEAVDRAASFQVLCEASQQRIRELEADLRDRDELRSACDEWRSRAEQAQTSYETEAVKARSIAAENEVLASSYLDLAGRAEELELKSSMASNAVLRSELGVSTSLESQPDELGNAFDGTASPSLYSPRYTGNTTLTSPVPVAVSSDHDVARIVKAYTSSGGPIPSASPRLGTE